MAVQARQQVTAQNQACRFPSSNFFLLPAIFSTRLLARQDTTFSPLPDD